MINVPNQCYGYFSWLVYWWIYNNPTSKLFYNSCHLSFVCKLCIVGRLDFKSLKTYKFRLLLPLCCWHSNNDSLCNYYIILIYKSDFTKNVIFTLHIFGKLNKSYITEWSRIHYNIYFTKKKNLNKFGPIYKMTKW